METYKNKRKSIKSSISRIQSYINEQKGKDEVNKIQIKVYLDRLETKFIEYENIQSEIDNLTKEGDMLDEDTQREDMEVKYYSIKTDCLQLLQYNFTPSVINQSSETQRSNDELLSALESLTINQNTLNSVLSEFVKEPVKSPDLRLPNVNIPLFYGNFEDWTAFRDLFVSLVHDNQKLTNAQKLQFLKTTLKGEAASTLKHLPVSDANYVEAWNELNSKYNKPKQIINSHLKTIIEYPTVQCNATAIRGLSNSMTESVRALRALKLSTDSWDCWLVYIVNSKLDQESRQLWLRETASNDSPSFDQIISFLSRRELELQVGQSQKKPFVPKQKQQETKHILNATLPRCKKCVGHHPLYRCFSFKNLDVKARKQFVADNKLCANCLSSDHQLNKCKSSMCRVCSQKHHTLLHIYEITNNADQKQVFEPSVQCSAATLQSSLHHSTSILPTAVVLIKDSSNKFQLCRALLDSGAEASLITEACVQRLRLKRVHAKLPVSGIGSNLCQTTRGSVEITVKSRYNDELVTTNALILSTLCNLIPSTPINVQEAAHFENLKLADMNFCTPGPVDILIGSDLFFSILREGRITHKNHIVAQNTIFGFVIGGKVERNLSNSPQILHVSINIDKLLQRFWEIDELHENIVYLTDEEKKCEQEYASKHIRTSEGRYVVTLPFKTETIQLGESRSSALSSLKMMEHRFKRNTNFHQQYKDFMSEYIQLGHMRLLTNSEQSSGEETYYIPHHAVLKESSSTTKLRVVFNASKITSSGISLNEKLIVGPTVQDDLISILTRFRTHKIALTADISKMYRQVRIAESDTRYQRILWRDSEKDPVREYELLTVTYGTASAPYLATRTLNQLASDEQSNYPSVSTIIRTSFYVDDLMTGAETIEAAIHLYNELSNALHAGGFELRKWSSNSKQVLATIPESRQEIKSEKLINDSENISVKTLGLSWNVIEDYFFFHPVMLNENTSTKRDILSTIAKIFDPLGWLAPCVVKAKIMMQQLWLLGVGWDDNLPENILKDWTNFYKQLEHIKQMKIPRWMPFVSRNLELHIFSDASEKAYATVAYLTSRDSEHQVTVSLVAAKTRVAPIKQVSLPRLELCAAHLASKLAKNLCTTLSLTNTIVHAWTDSKIVLAWLTDHPRRWTTFVGNRTSEILSTIPRHQWHHVPSTMNPADCASRGISPEMLDSSHIWWHGPSYLRNKTCSELYQTKIHYETINELKKNILTTSIQQDHLLYRYSSFSKLKRITAYCMKFKKRKDSSQQSKQISNQHNVKPLLSLHELQLAANIWYRHMQQEVFSAEINLLKAKKPLSTKSTLLAYNPFIDEHDVLRVGGRLENSNIPFIQKHPVILPGNHQLTEMIIRDQHIMHMHAGPRLLQSIICTNFMIIGCKRAIKKVIYKCVKCIRHKAETQQQQMGQLPKVRVVPARPFENTGVDYAGPLMVRSWKGRGGKLHKAYIALFVCLCTKAFHLELVSGLSTEDFILAFKRFTARRGLCKTIYSDNGTAFVGANRHFRELGDLLKSSEHQVKLINFAAEKSMQWHFIPPSAPHFGGIWESGVKLVKYHLRRQLSNATATFEELTTLLCQIEAIINSRPLSATIADDDQMEVITPAHFLIGAPLLSVPESNHHGKAISTASRWQYLQRLHQSFWYQWHTQYLYQLQRRNKWKSPSHNLQLGDITLIKEDNLPPATWALGRIVNIHPGKDNIVRVVTLKTKSGLLTRPVAKLVLLLKDDF